MDLKELLAQPLAQARPADFVLDEVVVRWFDRTSGSSGTR